MVSTAPFEEQAFGRYRLLERLGEGGMAEVFRAKSFGVEGFEKIVAIKRILPRLARYRDFVAMFVREAKVLVRLSHANVVQVFDLGRVEGKGDEPPAYFMAMEYIAGLDLATMLTRCQQVGVRPPPGLATYVAAEVAKGLDHAHRRRGEGGQPMGLVHRDVSPQNILLSWEGEVKVTDFGIAKARDSFEVNSEDSRVKLLRGKYAYMSPEQARGRDVGQDTDLYSLGVVLYEILSGANPFRAPQPLETMRRVCQADAPPLERLVPGLDPGLVAVVRQAMAPLPSGRFVDAAAMHEALLPHLSARHGRFGPSDLADFLRRLSEQLATNRVPVSEKTPIAAPSHLTHDVDHDRTDVDLPDRDDEMAQASRLLVLGRDLLLQGDLPRAGDALGRVLVMAERHGASAQASQARMYLGYLDALAGLPGGEALLRDGLAEAAAQGHRAGARQGRFLLGRLLENIGLPRAALVEYEACRRLAITDDDPLLATECDEALARLA
ncbi:MAG: serine/threonine protein kinase [Myxococcales bacterium]|nr:MAG: serine/threonine protein kinase [Myxococcales bacterium]